MTVFADVQRAIIGAVSLRPPVARFGNPAFVVGGIEIAFAGLLLARWRGRPS